MFGWNESTTKINTLIQKKKYPAAIKLLYMELEKSPNSHFHRQQLANLLVKVGKEISAMKLMNELAEEYSQSGFLTKALAMYKQMQRIKPDQLWIDEKIIALGQERGKKITPLASAFTAPQAETVPAGDVIEISSVEEELEFEVSGGKLSVDDSFSEQPKTDPIYSSPLFLSISQDELNAFIQGLDFRSYQPGEIIFSEGEQGDSLMVLASGSLRVYVRNQSGKNEQVRILNEGAFFGEISLLSRKPRTATLIAMSFVEILELDKKSLANIARKNPEIPKVLKEYYMKRVNSPEEQKARND